MVEKPATTQIPRQLLESDVHGKGAAEIGWGSHGDFDRCRLFMRRHGVPGHQIDGACANLHRIATGEWPGRNAHKGHLASTALIALVAAASPQHRTPWWGPLAPINKATGDGRIFPPGILQYQSFPMALRWQEKGSRGHDGAVTVATIEGAKEIMVDGEPKVWAYGYWLDPQIIPEVTKAQHQVDNGVTGPSVDLDSYTAALMEHAETGKKVASLSAGRMRAATLVNIPAFADLRITTGEPGDKIPHFPDVITASLDEETVVHFAVNGDTWHKAPIAPREALFDADDAVSRIEAWANGDPAKMASAFLWVNTDNGPLLGRQGYRLPWGDVIDGRMMLVYHAAYSAAALLSDAHGGLPHIPDEDKAKLRSIISEIYQKLAAEFNDPQMVAPWDRQDAQADGEVEEFADEEQVFLDLQCDCDCIECQLIDSDTFDAADIEEFLGRYTEAKHPRDPRKNKHAGEWVDVPGHDAHGRIKVGGKWAYPPKKGGRGHKRADHEPRHGADQTKERGAKDPYRYQGRRRVEDAEREERRATKAPAEPKKTQTRVAKKAVKAPERKPEPEKKEAAKKAPAVKKAAPQKPKAQTRVAKKAPVAKKEHKVTPAQQKALDGLKGGDASLKTNNPSVKVLEREGFIEKVPGGEHKRDPQMHQYRLTQKGKDHLGVKGAEKPVKKAAPEAKASEAEAESSRKHPATEAGVRAAFDDVLKDQGVENDPDGTWVNIADLRDRMGGTRAEQDAALKAIEQRSDVNIVPQANQKALNTRTRAAAVRIGGQDKTHLTIIPRGAPESERPAAKKATPKPQVDVKAQAKQFEALRDRDKAREFLKDMPKRDLVPLAAEVGVPHRKADNAQQIRDALVRYAGAGEDHDVIVGRAGERRGAVERAAAPRKAASGVQVAKKTSAPAPRGRAQEEQGRNEDKQGDGKIDPAKRSDKPKKRNNWGGGHKEGEHYFHPDGAVGMALAGIGNDGDIDVDGDRLDNRLGDVATAVVTGTITPDAGLAEYKKLRDRLPEGSRSRRALDSAIQDMDAPPGKRPASYEGAPRPLRELMDALLENPLARGNAQAKRDRQDHTSEVERLDQLMKDWHEGKLSKIRAPRMVQEQLHNRHHESNEGKVPLDRAVAKTIRDIERMDKGAWDAGGSPAPPVRKAPTGTSAKRIRARDAAEELKMRRADRDARLKEIGDEIAGIERQIRFEERELRDPDNAWYADAVRARIAERQTEIKVLEGQRDRLEKVPDNQLDDARKRTSLDPEADKLGRKFSSGEKDAQRQRIRAGAQGRKERLTLPDGSIVFSKQLDARGLNPSHNGVAEADSEELASLLGRAFGAPVPVVARADDTHILMDWVEGKTFGDVLPHERQRAEVDPAYKLMGLLDLLTWNIDRHRGNMMVADGKPVAIDNGLAWSRLSQAGGAPLAAHIRKMLNNPPFGPADQWHGYGLHATDARDLKAKLETLRPAFVSRGRESWLDFALGVVDELEKRPDKKRLR